MSSSNPIIPVILSRPTPHTHNVFQTHSLVLTPHKGCLFTAVATNKQPNSAFKKYKERKERKDKKQAQSRQMEIENSLEKPKIHYKLKIRQTTHHNFNKIENTNEAQTLFFDPNAAPLYQGSDSDYLSLPVTRSNVPASVQLIQQVKQRLVQQKIIVQHSEDIFQTLYREVPGQISDIFIVFRKEKVKKSKQKQRSQLKTKYIKKQKNGKKDNQNRTGQGNSCKEIASLAKSMHESSDNEISMDRLELIENTDNPKKIRKICTLDQLMRKAQEKVATACPEQQSPRHTQFGLMPLDLP